jgi:hypothetical protein
MAEVDNFHVYILFNGRTIETRKPFPEPEIDAINEEGEEINQRPFPEVSVCGKEHGKGFLEAFFAHKPPIEMYLVDKKGTVRGVNVLFVTEIHICPVQHLHICSQLALCHLARHIGRDVL